MINPSYIFNKYENKVIIDGKEYRLCYLDPFKKTVGVMMDIERVELNPKDATFNLETVCNILSQYINTEEYSKTGDFIK